MRPRRRCSRASGGPARPGRRPRTSRGGFAGDGGTADITCRRSPAPSTATTTCSICYDNEAYMNTGIQKSSLTPFGASTTTTPAGKREHGCLTQKKSLFDIVAAHRIPYAATASVGYLNDFIKKVERARDIKGTRFIHVMAPCPVGWGFPSADMVDVAKEIVDTGRDLALRGPALRARPGGAFRLNQTLCSNPSTLPAPPASADDGPISPHRAHERHARDMGIGKAGAAVAPFSKLGRGFVSGLLREKMRYNGLRTTGNVKRPWLMDRTVLIRRLWFDSYWAHQKNGPVASTGPWRFWSG
ncbi:MAG: thiamine pyrophosphate-dependent enzyme [Adlercreutzia sp.]